MPDIFLSYNREDQPKARRFAEALQRQGLDVWWDTELRSGEAYDQVTEKALREARAVVVLWSARSVESRWVRAEAALALRLGTLVPAMIAPCERPIMFELTQTADLCHWQGDENDPAWLAFVADVNRFIGADAAARPRRDSSRAAAPVAPGKPSVAVLPFANLSGDAEQGYFSDGISEDIINDLGKVSALWVAARNSVFTFKDRHVDVRDAARQLGVSHVLEGSVRRAGDRVRITAQLIDGATGGQVWAERFDRNFSDIFALQDEISQSIVKALKLKLLPEEKRAIEHRGTANSQAYELYLKARQYYISGNERHDELIVRLCRRAIEIDPSYAHAWALLAHALRSLHYRGISADDGGEAAERAVSLAPDLADAYAMRADVMRARGQLDRAIADAQIALRLDPESYEANRAAGVAYSRARRFHEAIDCLEKAASLMDNDYHAAAQVIQCYQGIGDEAAARDAARRAFARIERLCEIDPGHGSAMGHGAGVLALLGERERAREYVARAVLLDPENQNLQGNLVCVMVLNGDLEEALDQLARVLESPTRPLLNWIATDNDLDPLREMPRFRTLMAQAEARLRP
ncbi:MAG TPA: TIR domain-containing protein [Steroidobacteraceae bacterium]|nr:TIR domain-containing protein [Steroidobacteraceae bacterium]